jgi:hypothetical protein
VCAAALYLAVVDAHDEEERGIAPVHHLPPLVLHKPALQHPNVILISNFINLLFEKQIIDLN